MLRSSQNPPSECAGFACDQSRQLHELLLLIAGPPRTLTCIVLCAELRTFADSLALNLMCWLAEHSL